MDNKKTKSNKFYDRCQRPGHTIDQYFKLDGYPDQYDASKDKNKGKEGSRMTTHVYSKNSEGCVQGTPLEEFGSSKTVAREFYSNLLQALAQEIMKLMEGKQVGQQYDNLHSFAHVAGTPLVSF